MKVIIIFIIKIILTNSPLTGQRRYETREGTIFTVNCGYCFVTVLLASFIGTFLIGIIGDKQYRVSEYVDNRLLVNVFETGLYIAADFVNHFLFPNVLQGRELIFVRSHD